MIVYRLMSVAEFIALVSGKILTNLTDHSEEWDSTGKGFCFIPEVYQEWHALFIPSRHYAPSDGFKNIVIPDTVFYDFLHLSEGALPELGVITQLRIPDAQLTKSLGGYGSIRFGETVYEEVCTTQYSIGHGVELLGYRFFVKKYEFRYIGFENNMRHLPVPLQKPRNSKTLKRELQLAHDFAENPEAFVEVEDLWAPREPRQNIPTAET